MSKNLIIHIYKSYKYIFFIFVIFLIYFLNLTGITYCQDTLESSSMNTSSTTTLSIYGLLGCIGVGVITYLVYRWYTGGGSTSSVEPQQISSVQPQQVNVEPQQISSVQPQQVNVEPQQISSVQPQQVNVEPQQISSVQPQQVNVEPQQISSVQPQQVNVEPIGFDIDSTLLIPNIEQQSYLLFDMNHLRILAENSIFPLEDIINLNFPIGSDNILLIIQCYIMLSSKLLSLIELVFSNRNFIGFYVGVYDITSLEMLQEFVKYIFSIHVSIVDATLTIDLPELERTELVRTLETINSRVFSSINIIEQIINTSHEYDNDNIVYDSD